MHHRKFLNLIVIFSMFLPVGTALSGAPTAGSSGDGLARPAAPAQGELDWLPLDPTGAPAPRSSAAFTYADNLGGLLLFGGDTFDLILPAYYDDTYLWNASGWQTLSPAHSPPARGEAGMAYDAQRGRMILFGGYDLGGEMGDTWEFDGQDWIQAAPGLSPPPRAAHGMIYRTASGQILLFGGYGDGQFFADTWSYAGGSWQQVQTAHSPSPRRQFGMAYDSARDRVVLFGGCIDWGCATTLNDTWEFDGQDWLQIQPPVAPAGRAAPGLAYDPDRQVSVLFGGCSALLLWHDCWGVSYADAWEYDGSGWVERHTATRPLGRYELALGYDHTRMATVLFGGRMDYTVFQNDAWQLAPPLPEPETPQPIVLVHGWKGLALDPNDWRYCDEGVLKLEEADYNTFPNLAEWLSELDGYEIWLAHVTTGALETPPLEENTACLAEQVKTVHEQTGRKVILIGHSMGGLLNRACMNLSGCREHVRAVYSLGSPHAGINTLFLLKLLAYYYGVDWGVDVLCEWQEAVCQFSTEGILWFNLANPNQYGSPYTFIGGTHTPFPLGWLLLPLEGANDGAIGSYSAVGWLYPFGWNVVRGPEAKRYWTDENHSDAYGPPSYFSAVDASKSQAYYCLESWLTGGQGDACTPVGSLLAAPDDGAQLSQTTRTLVGQIESHQAITRSLQIDTDGRSVVYLSYGRGVLDFSLERPDGVLMTPEYAASHPDEVAYASNLPEDADLLYASYAFTSTLPGAYTLHIETQDLGSEPAGWSAFAALESPRKLLVQTGQELYQVGDSAHITATLSSAAGGGLDGVTGQALLIRSDGVTETLALSGQGGGLYRAEWSVPDSPGYAQAAFIFSGDDNGVPFTRQVDALLQIAPHGASLTGSFAERLVDADSDGYSDALVMDVGLNAAQPASYLLSADLAAPGGQVVAHAALYTDLASGAQTAALSFDAQDIRRSRLDGPYTLTNLLLLDPQSGSLPAVVANDLFTTAAYHWGEFGYSSVYLPLARR